MKRLLRMIRHFMSPSLLFAGFLLFGLTPVLQVSCQDQVKQFTGKELASIKGPLGERETNPFVSPFANTEGSNRQALLQADSNRARHLRLGVLWVLILGGAGAVATAFVLWPRAQAILAALLGIGNFWLISRTGARLARAIQADQANSMLSAKLLPAWSYTSWLMLLAGLFGLVTLFRSFRANPPQPIYSFSGAGNGKSLFGFLRGVLRIKIVVLVVVVVVVAFGLVFGPRWYRILFVVGSTVSVPQGCIDIDSLPPAGDTSANHPPRHVCAGPLEVDRYEVTQSRFPLSGKDAKQDGPCQDKACAPRRGDYPTYGVLWTSADSFCRSEGKRLPTLSEWEYFARAGDRSYDFFDRVEGNIRGVLGKGDLFPATAPVGSFRPNALGIYDVVGNVEEWTSTCWDASDKLVPAWEMADRIKLESIHCGLAGRSWSFSPDYDRGDWWGSAHPMLDRNKIGFRCVR